MKKSRWLCTGLVCAGLARAVGAAEIQCVADGASGEYCGTGYGITVNVSTPSSGYTIKYAAAETGPWWDELKYVDVCTAKPIWYQVSAPGYETKTGSADVTVTPKTLTSDFVWGVYPMDGYVYDGTAKEPDTACSDGEQSIITPDDFTVSYENNVNAGTAKIVFTGKNNYAGTVEEEFEIMKADNAWTTEPALADWTYGQAASEPVSAARHGTATVTWSSGAKPTLPGSYTATFTVPASRNYRELTATVPFTIRAATIACVADGASGEYCGTGYGISVNVATPSTGYTVKYAAAETGPWVDELKYVDVCTAKPIWYQVSAPGYDTKTGSADVTVTPKTLTSDFVWGVYPPDDYVYDGTAKEPDTACGDGEPSIITPDDFTVSYENNVNAGTAKIVFTGKNNYAGTVEEEFEIAKATVGGGNEPGTGTVPPGGISKWDVQVEYDGRAHTLDTNGLASAVAALGAGYVPAVDFAVQYAAGEEGVAPDAGWDVAPASFVNAGTNIVWYKVAAANFDDFAHAVRIVITPRAISHATIAPIPDQTFDGTPCEPVPVVTDGEPAIVTADDYTVSYADNAAPGMATLTLTGRGNYAGTKVVTFVILSAARDVVFDALGGRIGSAVAVTQSVTRVYGDLPTATRAGYVLDGWFLGVTNGAPQAVRGAALLTDADHALYARWSPDPAAASDPETLYAWEATGAATARILGLRDPNVRLAQLILPDRIGGLFVTEIAASAFANTTCGATALALPVFCTAVGDKAFYNATTLASVAFADARRWDSPAAAAAVAVGRYAFSTCLGLEEVTLAESVSSIGDYAFINCRKLRKIVVLGRPDVGRQAFRSAGLDGAGGVEVLIDQALADDADYMARLKAGVPSVTVRTDAIVTALRTAALAVSGRTVRLAVAVERAAAWGAVDASALRVEYRARLGDAPAVLAPRAVVRGADGSLTLEVEAPEGESGFFRVRMGE